MQSFIDNEREASEVKTECLLQMRGQAEVEALIPASIDIGLFRLNCERVRRCVQHFSRCA